MSPTAKDAKDAKEVTSEGYPEPDPTLSSDAQHSTYAEVTPDEEKVPPDGPMVEQTRGVPAEA